MEESVESVKWLAIDNQIESFKSAWGAICQPYYNETVGEWLLPLGWETELEARGIDFELIEIIGDEGGV